MFQKLCFIIAASTIAASSAFAAVVPSSALVSTSVTYKVGSTSKHKVIYCLKRVPGNAKSVTGGLLFTSFATTISQLTARHIGGTQLATFVALNTAGKIACKKAAATIPSPTPTPSNLNFDANGNVTPQGKIAFGIPSNLSGNITAGHQLSASYCTCHVERIGASFPFVRAQIAQPPMLFDSTQITDDMLANIIAYLNRFSLQSSSMNVP
jgi:hypothetical protein